MAPQVCRSLRYKDPLCIRPCQCPYCTRSHYPWVLETAVLRRSWKCAEASIVDLWVMKIKSPWSFVCVVCPLITWTEHKTQITQREHVKGLFIRESKWQDCMIIKHVRQTHFGRNSRGAQRCVGLYFLVVLFGCWLAGRANSDHVLLIRSVILLNCTEGSKANF